MRASLLLAFNLPGALLARTPAYDPLYERAMRAHGKQPAKQHSSLQGSARDGCIFTDIDEVKLEPMNCRHSGFRSACLTRSHLCAAGVPLRQYLGSHVVC